MKAHDKPYSVRQALWMAKEECEKLADNITKVENALRCPHLVWEYLSPFLMAKNFDQWEQLASGTPHDDYKSDAASDSDSDRDVYSYEDYYAPDESDPEAEDQDFATPLDNDPLSEKGGYTRVERKKNKQPAHPYVQWAMCADIQSKIRWNQSVIEQEELKQDGANHNYFGLLADGMPTLKPTLLQIPDRDRPLALLTGNVWRMSMRERGRLIESWKPEVQAFMMDELEGLLEKVQKIMSAKNNAFDDIRRTIIRGSSVVGMTTSGAAKMQALIEAVAPNIIICEEAGEVLESHILAALSASTQHLILIGDHLQLRPQIETYTLSSDSTVGQNYNLDKSLFERLVTDKKSPLPLSHLTIQRRMRPEISSLIRNTLYPDLVDEKRVLEYPNVSGMGANLYFMDHAHAEDSRDQYGMQSFANSFEVRMVGALAQYLIKNGYDKPGDIAVLTPYLGQLSKLRDGLSDAFKLLIDERDQEKLDQGEQDAEVDGWRPKPTSEPAKQESLTLRTIDNYQGEEAKIVIISLVRSDIKESGEKADWSSIGFLKSPNRTNVLLSRAQHGMYLIGNAGLMAQEKHGLWPKIMEELRASDRVGGGFAITCKEHGIASTATHTTRSTFHSNVLSHALTYIKVVIMSVQKRAAKSVATAWKLSRTLFSRVDMFSSNPDATRPRI
ncbi:hypothetical protein BGZ54_001634 [Gamsiella multidivaricata]|nr:hypothetical protein BGZ54_001634 [Gamsiella multidivaricata]